MAELGRVVSSLAFIIYTPMGKVVVVAIINPEVPKSVVVDV